MLSIIIPSLNEEKYLPLLLRSIKRQNFSDYEIILADAGSTDKTKDIARQYGCIVIEGGLVAKGRNNGAKIARGDILLFLDSDVILPAEFLKNASDEFKSKKLGVAGFAMRAIGGNVIDGLVFNIFNAFAMVVGKLSPHVVAAIMSQKKVHEQIGGFDESITFLEDYSYAIKASKVSKYKFLNVPFYTSVRRFKKDGRIKTYLRYALAEIYIIFFGPIKSDIFKYRFNHYEEKTKK